VILHLHDRHHALPAPDGGQVTNVAGPKVADGEELILFGAVEIVGLTMYTRQFYAASWDEAERECLARDWYQLGAIIAQGTVATPLEG